MLTLKQEWEKFRGETIIDSVDEREEAIAKFCFYAGFVLFTQRMDYLNKSKLPLQAKLMALKIQRDELLEFMEDYQKEPAIPDRIVYD